MVTEMILKKFDFTKDENNSKLKEVFRNNKKLKEMHVDIYPENPLIANSSSFMLLLRTIEKNVIILNDDKRLVVKKNIEKIDTYYMNVLFENIKECYYKFFDNCCELILNVQNIYYRIIIFD